MTGRPHPGFPAAWNLCHDFAWSHDACKFSCRHAWESRRPRAAPPRADVRRAGPSLAKPGRTHARIFLQHGISAMILPAVTSHANFPADAQPRVLGHRRARGGQRAYKVKIGVSASFDFRQVSASFGGLQVSFSKFRLLASLKFWVAKFRRVVSASSAGAELSTRPALR